MPDAPDPTTPEGQQQQATNDETSPAVADKGFPANTPIKDMSEGEQAAYWKFQARKHEQAVRERGDYDELKAFRAQAEQAQLSEHERAVIAARDEGRAAAEQAANERAATAIFRAGLNARGVNADEIGELLEAFAPAKFVKDGDVDTDRVSALAARLAGNGDKWPDMGQGNTHRAVKAAGVSAGADMFAASKK